MGVTHSAWDEQVKPHTIPKQNYAETSLYATFPTLQRKATSAVYRENHNKAIEDSAGNKIDHIG